MTTATKAKKTIESFKAQQEKLRKAHNKRCELARSGAISEFDSLRQYHAGQAEYEILKRKIEYAGLADHILNKTVTFQSGPQFKDGNHELGDLLEKQFPQGRNDSESGQGFFYINEKFVPEVMAWLKDKVEIATPGASEYQRAVEELAAKAKGRPSLGTSATVSLMLK